MESTTVCVFICLRTCLDVIVLLCVELNAHWTISVPVFAEALLLCHLSLQYNIGQQGLSNILSYFLHF